jgi:hypothetical protein
LYTEFGLRDVADIPNPKIKRLEAMQKVTIHIDLIRKLLSVCLRSYKGSKMFKSNFAHIIASDAQKNPYRQAPSKFPFWRYSESTAAQVRDKLAVVHKAKSLDFLVNVGI